MIRNRIAAPIATGIGFNWASSNQYFPRSFARVQKSERGPADSAAGEGLAELAPLAEPCCAGDAVFVWVEVVGDGAVAGPDVPVAGDAVDGFTLPALDPAEEFALPALFDSFDEFALPDLLEFSPGLFAAVDALVLPDFDLVFELPGELELSRVEEFRLALAVV
jgi:hypothetical protein